MPTQNPILKLSKHLFWDTDRNNLTVDKNKGFIIQRVLEYGLIADWHIIKEWYGIKEIGDTACQFRSLEPRALAFILNISKIPIEKFRCYFTKQLTQTHWDY